MGLWQRLFGSQRKSSTLEIFREVFGYPAVKSGVSVNWQTAIQVVVVFAAARVIAEGVAQLPLKVYRERKDGGKDLAKDHGLYRLLHRRPNEWQTSFEFRESLTLHAVLTGGGFALKGLVRGQVVELLPLLPNWVTIKRREDWSLVYEIRPKIADDAGPVPAIAVPRERMFHLRGPSWDAIRGLDVVKLAREAIGLAIATEEHHARLHANGAKPSGIYTVEGVLGDAQYNQIRAWIEKHHAGAENAGRPMILDRSAKWIAQAMTGVDTEHLATRKFQIEEVCRAMRVFPQLVMQSDKTSTFASAEAFFNAHNTHSLGPWLERWTQTIDRDLLSESDVSDGISAEFVIEALLHAAIKDKGEFLAKMVTAGIMSRNEGRGKLNLNPRPGLDDPLVPQNMATVDEDGGVTPASEPSAPVEEDPDGDA